MRDITLYNIKSQRYGGGLRWCCTVCDEDSRSIRWTNSRPPKICVRCAKRNLTHFASQVETVLRDELPALGSAALQGRLLELGWVPDGVSVRRLAAMVRSMHVEMIA